MFSTGCPRRIWLAPQLLCNYGATALCWNGVSCLCWSTPALARCMARCTCWTQACQCLWQLRKSSICCHQPMRSWLRSTVLPHSGSLAGWWGNFGVSALPTCDRQTPLRSCGPLCLGSILSSRMQQSSLEPMESAALPQLPSTSCLCLSGWHQNSSSASVTPSAA